MEQQHIDWARLTAQSQINWYADRNLYYKEPPKPGRASWGIALHPHFITPEQYATLTTVTPDIISSYHQMSAHLLRLALDPNVRGESPILERMHHVLTIANPPETEALWKEMLALGKTMPASSRPDILIPSGSNIPLQHIEYNADGSADKGNTLGVAKVTQEVLGSQTVGISLDQAFIKGIRHQLPNHDLITVATVLPDNYRTEYDPQNIFFAKQINDTEGINWLSAKVSQLDYRSTGVYVGDKKIDIVDREIKAPGFLDTHNFQTEMDLYKAVIEQKVEMFGSVLPHGDKFFLAALFDPALESIIKGVIGESSLKRLRAYHPTTHLFTPDKRSYQFKDKEVMIDEIRNPSPDQGFVLKHTGDNIYTTGSNGVFISLGYKSEGWSDIVDQALATGLGRRTYLVLQELVEPQRFGIEAISSTTAVPKKFTVPTRFAPYYVRIGDEYVLGDALVTSGTDREVEKLNSFNIHGQRDNTYQGVAVK